MNNQHQLPIASCLSQTHCVNQASSAIALRVELFDMLQSSLETALNMQAHVSLAQHKLCNVSFISLQKLFHRIAMANLDYIDFLGLRIRELGGISETDALMRALYPATDTAHSGNFATCIDGIHQGTMCLAQLDSQMRLDCNAVGAGNDLASKRFIDTYRRRTLAFTSLIRDNLPQGYANDATSQN